MRPGERSRPIVWLHGEIRSPPFGREARIEAGVLLRRIQEGEIPGMPQARPMPAIGARCHELRIADRRATWRIVVRTDAEAVVVLEVFAKTTPATPRRVIQLCRRRLRAWEAARSERSEGA